MPETARIILVDDEPALLKLMKSYLERLGHQVEAYPNGVDALAGFAATPTTFSLLVADLTLPDMSGLDMAIEMAKQNLSLRVVICSGYPFDIGLLEESLQSRFQFLQKPFLPNMLSQSVADSLHR